MPKGGCDEEKRQKLNGKIEPSVGKAENVLPKQPPGNSKQVTGSPKKSLGAKAKHSATSGQDGTSLSQGKNADKSKHCTNVSKTQASLCESSSKAQDSGNGLENLEFGESNKPSKWKTFVAPKFVKDPTLPPDLISELHNHFRATEQNMGRLSGSVCDDIPPALPAKSFKKQTNSHRKNTNDSQPDARPNTESTNVDSCKSFSNSILETSSASTVCDSTRNGPSNRLFVSRKNSNHPLKLDLKDCNNSILPRPSPLDKTFRAYDWKAVEEIERECLSPPYISGHEQPYTKTPKFPHINDSESDVALSSTGSYDFSRSDLGSSNPVSPLNFASSSVPSTPLLGRSHLNDKEAGGQNSFFGDFVRSLSMKRKKRKFSAVDNSKHSITVNGCERSQAQSSPTLMRRSRSSSSGSTFGKPYSKPSHLGTFGKKSSLYTTKAGSTLSSKSKVGNNWFLSTYGN